MAKQRVSITPTKLRRLYYVEHRSAGEVARRLGCSPTTVRNYLDRYNFRVKRQSEIMKGRKLNPEHRAQVIKTLRNYTSDKV